MEDSMSYKLARYDERLRVLEKEIEKLDHLEEKISQLQADIRVLREELRHLNDKVERLSNELMKKNGTQKWLIGLLLSTSVALIGTTIALLLSLH